MDAEKEGTRQRLLQLAEEGSELSRRRFNLGSALDPEIARRSYERDSMRHSKVMSEVVDSYAKERAEVEKQKKKKPLHPAM